MEKQTEEDKRMLELGKKELQIVRNFTWPELLQYNISFLKGEKEGTFYHLAPLLPDQVPEDLIAIQKRGIFTCDGQGAGTETGIREHDSLPYIEKRKAYLQAYLPLSLAAQVLRGARRDNEVVFELTLLRTGEQIYVSNELDTLWKEGKSFSLTKDKLTDKENPWDYPTNISGPMGSFDAVMNESTFARWDEWVQDGLCVLIIADKEYDQEPKSMSLRILGYLDAKTDYSLGGRRSHSMKRKTSKKWTVRT
jgi:hypothetical protein